MLKTHTIIDKIADYYKSTQGVFPEASQLLNYWFKFNAISCSYAEKLFCNPYKNGLLELEKYHQENFFLSSHESLLDFNNHYGVKAEIEIFHRFYDDILYAKIPEISQFCKLCNNYKPSSREKKLSQ